MMKNFQFNGQLSTASSDDRSGTLCRVSLTLTIR